MSNQYGFSLSLFYSTPFIRYDIDALFPDAIEANKTRMEEVMKKVEGVRGMTSGGSGQDPQTSMYFLLLFLFMQVCRISLY